MEPIELAILAAEVGRRFQFLVGLYGMEGPQGSHLLLPHQTPSHRGTDRGRALWLQITGDAGQRLASVLEWLLASGRSRPPGRLAKIRVIPAPSASHPAKTASSPQHTTA